MVMDKVPFRREGELVPDSGDVPSDAEAELERAGVDPADVGLTPETDSPTPRDHDPEDHWIGEGGVDTTPDLPGERPPAIRG